MDSMLMLAVGIFFMLFPLILLARVSHWSHLTQKKLDRTNQLLEQLLQRESR